MPRLLSKPPPRHSAGRMRQRALRAWLFMSVVVVAWAVARPAMAASAPYCDDRGASANAPPPTFQPTDEAVRAVLAERSFSLEGTLLWPTVLPDHSAELAGRGSPDQALPPEATVLPSPPGDDLPPADSQARAPSGVHHRVERPPRG
jgi:hypothetical protein